MVKLQRAYQSAESEIQCIEKSLTHLEVNTILCLLISGIGYSIMQHFIYFFIYFKKDYLFVRERAHKQGKKRADGEAGSLLSKEPNAGHDPS